MSINIADIFQSTSRVAPTINGLPITAKILDKLKGQRVMFAAEYTISYQVSILPDFNEVKCRLNGNVLVHQATGIVEEGPFIYSADINSLDKEELQKAVDAAVARLNKYLRQKSESRSQWYSKLHNRRFNEKRVTYTSEIHSAQSQIDEINAQIREASRTIEQYQRQLTTTPKPQSFTGEQAATIAKLHDERCGANRNRLSQQFLAEFEDHASAAKAPCTEAQSKIDQTNREINNARAQISRLRADSTPKTASRQIPVTAEQSAEINRLESEKRETEQSILEIQRNSSLSKRERVRKIEVLQHKRESLTIQIARLQTPQYETVPKKAGDHLIDIGVLGVNAWRISELKREIQLLQNTLPGQEDQLARAKEELSDAQMELAIAKSAVADAEISHLNKTITAKNAELTEAEGRKAAAYEARASFDSGHREDTFPCYTDVSEEPCISELKITTKQLNPSTFMDMTDKYYISIKKIAKIILITAFVITAVLLNIHLAHLAYMYAMLTYLNPGLAIGLSYTGLAILSLGEIGLGVMCGVHCQKAASSELIQTASKEAEKIAASYYKCANDAIRAAGEPDEATTMQATTA